MSSEIEIALEESKILKKTIKKVFPDVEQLKHKCPKLFQKDKDETAGTSIEIAEVVDMSDTKLLQCLQLLDDNLGALYSVINGAKWKTAKKTEMQEPGLVYIMLYQSFEQSKPKLISFISCKIINEADMCVLYLYEIQLAKSIQGFNLGTTLMKELDNIVTALNSFGKLKKLWYRNYPDEYSDKNDPLLHLSGVGLTVFSANAGAKRLYERLGYVLHADSPVEKHLRSGKVIEPDYYILEKRI